MIYLMQSKNFCKCHNVTPPQNNNKKLIWTIITTLDKYRWL
jgi:hypothetical protein